MKHVNIVLADSVHQNLVKLAGSQRVDVGQYCAALLTELAHQHTARPPHSPNGNDSSSNDQVTEIELMEEIISYLKQKGGSAPKTAVEGAVFEKLKDVFEHPHYGEPVGGGVPRWRKNVQFARNTARNMGLIKPPEVSGRGTWELTERGHHWKFDSK